VVLATHALDFISSSRCQTACSEGFFRWVFCPCSVKAFLCFWTLRPFQCSLWFLPTNPWTAPLPRTSLRPSPTSMVRVGEGSALGSILGRVGIFSPPSCNIKRQGGEQTRIAGIFGHHRLLELRSVATRRLLLSRYLTFNLSAIC